jgi:putative methionine-R-sulfoxide reductase with GAF domain
MDVDHARRETELRREREEDDRRFTNSLAGLAVALFLTWIGLYVVEQLFAESQLEDCVLQGRADCVRVDMTQDR